MKPPAAVMRSFFRSRFLVVTLCCALLVTGCGGAPERGQSPAPASPVAENKAISSDFVRQTLSGLGSVYETRAQDIRGRTVDGKFRLGVEGQYVPADLSYSASKIEALLDTGRPTSTRLDAGTDALSVLIAGYRTTELPQFAMSARDVLDYIRTVLKEANRQGPAFATFETAKLTPLETELSILETACSCPR